MIETLRPVLAAAAVALALGFLTPSAPVKAQGGPGGGEGPPPAPVVITEVKATPMSPTVSVPGTVISRNDAKIAAEVAGPVEWVAEPGAQIAQGDVLARIAKEVLQMALGTAEATVKRLEARLVFMNAQLERYRKLATSGTASASRFQEIESERNMTAQELEQAKIARDRARYDLAHAEIRAPFSGRVVERLVQPGEFTSIGVAVIRLVDTDNVEVRAQLPISAASSMAEGREIQIRGPQGMTIAGTIRALVPVGDEISRSLEIRVTLPAGQWFVGTPVEVAAPTGDTREVMAVHRDAIVLRADGKFVFRIGEGDVAERLPVETGIENGEMVELRGPFAAGDRLVVRGAENLAPGQKVTINAAS